MHIRGIKGSTRLTGKKSIVPMSAWHSSEITHTSGSGLGSRIREDEETKARRERQGLQ